MLNYYEWRCYVDFLDELREGEPGARALDYTEWHKIRDSVLRSCKWIKEVWMDHTAVFVVHTEADQLHVASERLAQARAAVMRVILRYRKLAQSKANQKRMAIQESIRQNGLELLERQRRLRN